MLLLHLLSARHFSRAGFVLIDEPLEHLDPINRRSVLRFLVEAHRRGLFSQALITTCEESLVRPYLRAPGVTVLQV